MSTVHPWYLIAAAVGAALLPIILGLFTCYAKVSIVVGLVRNALGAQQIPNAMVVTALSLAVTVYAMGDVFGACLAAFEQEHPMTFDRVPSANELARLQASFAPWRKFLMNHTGQRELALLGAEGGDPPLRILLPAFVVSELKSGFLAGFMLLLPFLMIDLIVANVLTGMGMQMLSPVVVALPLKLILFVLCDGWMVIMNGLVRSYATGSGG